MVILTLLAVVVSAIRLAKQQFENKNLGVVITALATFEFILIFSRVFRVFV